MYRCMECGVVMEKKTRTHLLPAQLFRAGMKPETCNGELEEFEPRGN